MCSIIGLKGYKIADAKYMLNILSHRGMDSKGIYYQQKLYLNDDINSLDDNLEDESLILAHNLLSIVGVNQAQPLISDNLVLVSNAEIYNYKQLVDEYGFNDLDGNSDCEIIIRIMEHYYEDNLEDAVLNTIKELDGDYAFCVSDSNNFMLVRDKMGVKPLYYSMDEGKFAFASEQKALKAIGCRNISNLNPRYALINDKLHCIHPDYLRCESDETYSNMKEELKNALSEAVKKRVEGLDSVALLFSAGVDSTLIAVLLKKLDVNFTAYTIGVENSQDLQTAKKVAQMIGIPLKYNVITQEDVEEYFYDTADAIEDNNLMKIGVGMTINMTSHLASLDGHKVILSGQGADELFCGYNRYKNKYNKPQELLDELTYDLNNMYHVNLERDDKATMNNSLELRVPFLDKDVVDVATRMPINYMLKSDDDKIRKHILRNVALELGVPEEVAYRPKKAAQYGTGIDKIIKKKLSKKDEFKEFIEKSRKNNKR